MSRMYKDVNLELISIELSCVGCSSYMLLPKKYLTFAELFLHQIKLAGCGIKSSMSLSMAFCVDPCRFADANMCQFCQVLDFSHHIQSRMGTFWCWEPWNPYMNHPQTCPVNCRDSYDPAPWWVESESSGAQDADRLNEGCMATTMMTSWHFGTITKCIISSSVSNHEGCSPSAQFGGQHSNWWKNPSGVISSMACCKPWTIEISDFPSDQNLHSVRGFSSQPCLKKPEG